MIGVRVTIVGFVDVHQPGFVRCELLDAAGRTWAFVEKVPVVSTAPLDASSSYPAAGFIACTVIERLSDVQSQARVRISTKKPWDIESVDGSTEFEVHPEQVTDE